MQKDDVIYRQDAIDALRMDINIIPFAKAREYVRAAIETIYNRLEELSPAQTESAQWVQMLINRNLYKCSNCQVAWNKRLVFDNDGYSENIFMKYCPCCGKRMKTKVGYE